MTEKIWLKVKHFHIRNMKNLWNFPAHIFLVSLNTFSVFFTAVKRKRRNMSILSLVSCKLDEVFPSIGIVFFLLARRTCISFLVQRNVPQSDAMILEKIVTQYSLTIYYLKNITCNLWLFRNVHLWTLYELVCHCSLPFTMQGESNQLVSIPVLNSFLINVTSSATLWKTYGMYKCLISFRKRKRNWWNEGVASRH